MSATKKYIITGTSSGIGRALALAFLEDENAHVYGLSRTCSISHTRYSHTFLDFSKPEDAAKFSMPLTGDEDEVYLINNAGTLGEVAPLGQQNPEEIANLYNINVVAPTLLMNAFLKVVTPFKKRRVIVNISSGAAHYPIKSWSNYCASKAALNMISRVAQEENPEIEIYGIAPGVVDTPMQNTIRQVKPSLFPDVARFQNYFTNGELSSTEEVANKIAHLLNNPSKIPQKLFSLRDIE